MNKIKIHRTASLAIISLTAFGVLMVSIQAFVNPQSVMDLVNVKLLNTDAFSSIRGIYGGIGLLIFIQLVYLAFKNYKQGLVVVALFGGLYALSRIITIFTEGSLGAFGMQWLLTETTICLIAILLLFLQTRLRGA
jgi:Domain of unknown function (DUF4345)